MTRNIPSRLTALSSCPSASSESIRNARSSTEKSSTAARKIRIVGPIELCVKEWTELKIPERVMNVPRIVRRKLAWMSVTVHPFKTPRRSITIAECSAAVAVSHGSSDAFSTGSQAQ